MTLGAAEGANGGAHSEGFAVLSLLSVLGWSSSITAVDDGEGIRLQIDKLGRRPIIVIADSVADVADYVFKRAAIADRAARRFDA
jgi:hypothetical protein